MIHLFDMNNYYRVLIERSLQGNPIRDALHKFNMISDAKIVVWDGPFGSKWRKALYPAYKGKRPPMGEAIFEAMNLAYEVFQHSSVIQVKIPDEEADDVVGSLARYSAVKGDKVAIYSTDWDMAQLASEYPERIFCGYNAASKPCGPELSLAYKILVGDTSDNVGGVPGFGRKSFLSSDPVALNRFVEAIAFDTLNESDFIGLTMSPKQQDWCLQNTGALKILHTIISLRPVPMDKITKHMVVGEPNQRKIEAILSELYL